MFGVLAVGTAGVAAQPSEAARNGAKHAFAGETMVYEGKVSRLRISVSVAELTFKAVSSPDGREMYIRTDAVSKGTLLKLFRYSFEQNFESIIDLENFRITKTIKRDVQKQRVRESEAVFNYDQKLVTWVETDPKDPNRPPRRIASDITEEVHDLISGIFALRLQPLAVGKRIDLTVSDSGLVYKVPVVVTGRKQMDTALGKKTWCFKLEPDVFGPGKLIEQKGKMVLWISDDQQRVPVRTQIDSQYGKIDIRLKSYQKGTNGTARRVT